MNELTCDALVVGGGPAGAWAARILSERGWQVVLWDRERFPRDKACGEYVSPGAVALLRSGGAGPAIEALGPTRIAGARIVTTDGSGFEGTFRREDGAGWSLRRRDLDTALLSMSRESGACVMEGTAFRSFARRDGWTVVEGRSDGEPVRARCRVLVGADGGHSAVARAIGVVRPIRRLQKVAFVTHARGIEGVADRVEMHAGRAGCVGLGPGPDGETNVTMVLSPQEARAARDVPDTVRRTVEGYPGLRGRFDGAAWDDQVLRVGTFGHTVTRAVDDGVVLVGDAATFIDPFTGEGVYFALRGAEIAADRIGAALAAGEASSVALVPYEHDRQQEFARKYALCRIVEGIVSHPSALRFLASRFRAHPVQADDLIRTTGDILPPDRVFTPSYWLRLLQ